MILFSWCIIIWSIIEYIKYKKAEKLYLESMSRLVEANRKLEQIGKYGVIIEEKD